VLDGRTDQFAWGVLAYELFAGRLPWRGAGDPLAVLASVLTDRVDSTPLDQAKVPPAVQDVILRALEKKPEDRFSTMDDVARALDAAERDGEPGVERARRAREQPQSATEAQRFSTGEVREVLARAVDQQAERDGSTKLGFEDLLAVAAEVGIDPESLREATRALRASQEKSVAPGGALVRKRDAWIRQQRLNLYRHAGVYGIVNAALLVLGLVVLSFTPWWIWFLPLLGWGVGLAIHALIALTASEGDFQEHEEGMKWWHENQRRQHGEQVVRSSPKLRVAPPDTEHDHDADEAVESEERKGRRGRR
jgi:hypothetical protein